MDGTDLAKNLAEDIAAHRFSAGRYLLRIPSPDLLKLGIFAMSTYIECSKGCRAIYSAPYMRQCPQCGQATYCKDTND